MSDCIPSSSLLISSWNGLRYIGPMITFTNDYVHQECARGQRLNYIHGFYGQQQLHGSFFKDWQGMLRGAVETQVRLNGSRDVTIIGIEGGPCSMEEADFDDGTMPQIITQPMVHNRDNIYIYIYISMYH